MCVTDLEFEIFRHFRCFASMGVYSWPIRIYLAWVAGVDNLVTLSRLDEIEFTWRDEATGFEKNTTSSNELSRRQTRWYDGTTNFHWIQWPTRVSSTHTPFQIQIKSWLRTALFHSIFSKSKKTKVDAVMYNKTVISYPSPIFNSWLATGIQHDLILKFSQFC